MNRILVFAVILTFCTPCAAQETSVEKLIAHSEPTIQAQINKVLDALDQSARNPQKNIEALQEIENLKSLTADESEIVKQLAIFAAAPDADERQRLMATAVLHLLQLRPKIVIPVNAPYLKAENRALHSFARGWFRGHDKGGSGASPLDPVNYEDYADYVTRKRVLNEDVPQAFIEYLYERSPERALLVFFRAAGKGDMVARLMELRKEQEANQREREKDGRDDELAARLAEWNKKLAALQGKDAVPVPPIPAIPPPVTNPSDKIPQQLEEKPPQEILLAEHIISNAIWLKKNKFGEEFYKALPAAKEQLSKLAKMDQWWVRLYVAEIMRRHRELRQVDVLEKLIDDSNSSVSKSAKSAKG